MNERIFIDFDGVIVDTQKYINILFNEYGNKITDEWNRRLENIKWAIEILPKSKEINNSFDILKELYKMKKDVYIFSRVFSGNEIIDKINYLKDQGIFIPFIPSWRRLKKSEVIIPDKSKLLIDDSKDNILDWINNNGQGIYFSSDEEELSNSKKIDFSNTDYQKNDGKIYFKNCVSDLSFLLKKTL